MSYRQVGALVLADREEDRERIRLALTARQTQAPEIGEVTGLSGAEAQRLFPPLRADTAAVHIGGAARVDGRQLGLPPAINLEPFTRCQGRQPAGNSRG